MTPVECNDIADVNTYRTIEGQCNNLNNPLWGAEFEQQPRFISEVYENGGEYLSYAIVYAYNHKTFEYNCRTQTKNINQSKCWICRNFVLRL